MNTVQDIRNKFIEKYRNKDFVVLKNGIKTIELINETFIADEDYIFKKPNLEYAKREIEWYKSESLNVYDIKGGKIPSTWIKVANRNGFINSNYGWCIYSEENKNQYRNCLRQLLDDNSSRRACMIYTRPSMQYDWNSDGMTDFMCTYSTQQFIRNNQLIYCVFMRSNDGVFGYRNDVAWHKYVADQLIKDLKDNKIDIMDSPKIIWTAGSLHIYETHFNEIEKIDDRQLTFQF